MNSTRANLEDRPAGTEPDLTEMLRWHGGWAGALALAIGPALEGRSGLYFNGLNEAKADAQAYDEDARQKLQYDLFYIKNQNLTLDATIMFETTKTILCGRGT